MAGTGSLGFPLGASRPIQKETPVESSDLRLQNGWVFWTPDPEQLGFQSLVFSEFLMHLNLDVKVYDS